MGTKSDKLVSILDQIIHLLHEDGNSHWVDRISKYRDQISNSDYYGVEDLLSDYGGMGSFNDIVLGHIVEDGSHTWKANSNLTNEKLQSLQSKAYALATDIRKDHQID